MSLVTQPIVGTIRIETLPDAGDPLPMGISDCTLESLLAALVENETLGRSPLAHGGQLVVASGRLRAAARCECEPAPVVRADLRRLVDDLEAEYVAHALGGEA